MEEPIKPIESFTTTTEKPISSPSSRKGGKGKIIAFFIILLILIGGGWKLASNSGKSDEELTPTPTEAVLGESDALPTEEPTEEPTPTEKPTPTPTTKPTPGPVNSAYDMNIQVQNGSGEDGVAGQGAQHLQDKGYKNVEAANADKEDYQGVTVQIKASRQEYLSTLLADLKEKYSNVTTGSALADSSDFDAVVIIGKQ